MTNEEPTRWVVDQRKELLDCKIFKIEQADSRTVDGGKRATFYTIRSKDWVNVVPITKDGQVVMVEQFRHGSGQISLETPGGILDGDESPTVAGLRELREETGYSGGTARVLGSVDANPAFMTNRFTAVLVEGVELTDPTAFDEHEDLRIRLVPVADLPDLLRQGEIQNTYSVLGITWFLLGYGPQRS